MSQSEPMKCLGGIAYWAYVGGFIAGVVMALVVRPRQASSNRPQWM